MANQKPAYLPFEEPQEEKRVERDEHTDNFGLTAEDKAELIELFPKEEEEETPTEWLPPYILTNVMEKDEFIAIVQSMLPDAIRGYKQLENQCIELSRACHTLNERRKLDDILIDQANAEIKKLDATVLAMRDTIRNLAQQCAVVSEENKRLRNQIQEITHEGTTTIKRRKPNA
jgi:hypothetical protein